MKASQVIARIEAAGWKKIRSEGSHAVFEHPKYGRRSTAFGKPQRDVNRHRLVEVIADFHLDEIEQAKIEARLAEAKRRPEPNRVSLARVVPEPESPVVMSDQEMRILWAQLHKEHGATQSQLATELKIPSGNLSDFLYHGQGLSSVHRKNLMTHLIVQERQLHLTRDRAALLQKGYGARTGASNAIDPFIPVVREAIEKTLDAGVKATELAQTIGIGASVIHGIKSGRSKTLHPDGKAKLQKWLAENWSEPEARPEPPKEAKSEIAPTLILQDKPAGAAKLDPEIDAIVTVMDAIKGLQRHVAIRALTYALERVKFS